MKILRPLVLPLFLLFVLVAASCGSSGVQNVVADNTPSTDAPVTEPNGGEPGPTSTAPTVDQPDSDVDGDDAVDEGPSVEVARLIESAGRAEVESYRAEMFMVMTMGAEGFVLDMGSPDTPMAVSAFDGVNTSTSIDLGVMMGDLFSTLGDVGVDELGFDPTDLTMYSVATPTDIYMRVPMFAASSAGLGTTVEWMDAAAQGWVRISLDQLDLDSVMSGFGTLTGNSATSSVDGYLDLIEQIADVEPLGPSQVRGVAVEGFRATASISDLMALQGASPDELLGEDFGQLFDDFEYTFDVYIDEDSLLRAVEIVMDDSFLDALADQAGEEMPSDFTFEMSMRMEIFDHGSPDVVVVVPNDAVDITDDFLSFLGELTG